MCVTFYIRNMHSMESERKRKIHKRNSNKFAFFPFVFLFILIKIEKNLYLFTNSYTSSVRICKNVFRLILSVSLTLSVFWLLLVFRYLDVAKPNIIFIWRYTHTHEEGRKIERKKSSFYQLGIPNAFSSIIPFRFW